MARIEILKNVTINTGKKLYREDTIQDSTKVLYDFRSKWAGAGVSSNVAANKVIKNLALRDTAMLTTKAATAVSSKGGITLTKGKSLMSATVDNFPLWTDSNWLIQTWAKFESFGTSTMTPVFHVSGGANWEYNLALASILLVSDANGAFSHMFCGGQGCQILTSESQSKSFLPNFNPTVPHLYSLKQTYDAATGRVTLSLYIDNVLIRSNGAVKTAEQTLTYRLIASPNTDASAPAGELYRYRCDLIGNTGINADDLIKNEYEKGSGLYF